MTTTARLVPVSGVCSNPFVGMRPSDLAAVRIGSRIGDLAPVTRDLLVCRLNGEWLPRAYWSERLQPGDVLEWFELPQGRTALQVVLAVIAIAYGIYSGDWYTAMQIYAIGSTVINLLVPVRPPEPQSGPGSVYSTSLNGNTARLDQPIWKICGRVKITPPFAGHPYLRFLPSNPAKPHEDCDQYYYALFAIGIGEHFIEKAFIGKTPLGHFRDVLRAQYLPPGTRPTEALANVVTSDEVSGFELNDQGKYAGPIIATRPGDKARAISIDIAGPQGLGWSDSDDTITAVWQTEVRSVNDYGSPIGEWQILGTETRTAQTNTPQRWTVDYNLPTPIRPQVRVARMDDRIEHPAARDTITWTGLRATLAKEAPLNPDCAHFEVVMRASEQLSNVSQRDFSMIVRGLVRPLLENGTQGAGERFSRNPADWLADLWLSNKWGEGFPASRVDLVGLYEWGKTCLARQDRFDYAFVSGSDVWSAAQLIARTGRARVFERHGVRTIARDELVTLPQRALTANNTQPGSMRYASALPRREQADGVVVEFQSNVTWDTATIECPCPGYSVSNSDDPRFDPALPPMQAPIFWKLEGVTGATHAEREGLYEAANMALRPATVSATVEMEGAIVTLMEAVRWQPALAGYGQSGEVTEYDPETLVMTLSEPPQWGDDSLMLTLQRNDLTLTDPVEVVPGPTRFDVVLPNPPDFALAMHHGDRERPKFLLGVDGDELAKITGISDAGKTESGAQLYRVEALVDDDRVHSADAHLLPSPGNVQDPVDDLIDDDLSADPGSGPGPAPDPGTGTAPPPTDSAIVVRLTDHDIRGGNNIGTGPDRGGVLTFVMFPNGLAGSNVTYTINDQTTTLEYPAIYANEWLIGSPVEPSVAAQYEVLVTCIAPPGYGAALNGTYDTWLPMTEQRAWSLVGGPDTSPNPWMSVVCLVRVRRIGTTTVLAERGVTFNLATGDTSS